MYDFSISNLGPHQDIAPSQDLSMAAVPQDRPVAIAKAGTLGANGQQSPPTSMPYTCLTCTKRKVKCDKLSPICSSCRKGVYDCVYQAPPPRRRKRKLSEDTDANDKAARYETILRQHGLLPDEDRQPAPENTAARTEISLRNEIQTAKTGKLVSGDGRSRYIDSNLWRNLGDTAMHPMYDEAHAEYEEEEHPIARFTWGYATDPLTGALMGPSCSLLSYHPSNTYAMQLFATYCTNVEPICKVIHQPTTKPLVDRVSRNPMNATPEEECLLFAIYHFATFTMTEEECNNAFSQSRTALLQGYHFAARQALVNASWLKTTSFQVMQAIVLFLLPGRYLYDASTYWILTGVATRISQRMGLHREGTTMDLPPFEVQMRRRVFYQVIPLEGVSAQMAGTAITIPPDAWDTLQPLNINDDQIWPGMTEAPTEPNAATEMMFCNARSTIGGIIARAGKLLTSVFGSGTQDVKNTEALIDDAEKDVESKYIRYCDIINPLHFLAIVSARCAITAMRLRIRSPGVRHGTATDAEKKEILQLCYKILDTDIAACTQTNLNRFRWFMQGLFLWGSWDSVVLILAMLNKHEIKDDADAAWSRIEQVYKIHPELVESRQASHMAVARLALKAWENSERGARIVEPDFIQTLRSVRQARAAKAAKVKAATLPPLGPTSTTSSTEDPSPASNLASGECDSANAQIDIFRAGDMNFEQFDLGDEYNIDSNDWMYWDKLIKDCQTQGLQEQSGLL